MNYSLIKGLGILGLAALLAAGCQTADSPAPATEAQSASAEAKKTQVAAENESLSRDEKAQIYAGYFDDSLVADRPLSDWAGDWQSVFPLLENGDLDGVFADKAAHSDDMTAEEYKDYYTEGYKTDIERLIITEDSVSFFKNGEEKTGRYTYDGFEILDYEAGNRGVRFVFKLEEETDGLPRFIQFSDHAIFPTDADHYHIYFGDDREALLEEVLNWPTFYPSDMDGAGIAEEMMAH